MYVIILGAGKIGRLLAKSLGKSTREFKSGLEEE